MRFIHQYVIAFLCLFSCFTRLSSEENPIIYMLFSHRSASTAFLKMMHYRGDFFTINEPLSSLFFEEKFGDVAVRKNKSFKTLPDLESDLIRYQQTSPVFFKDAVTHFSHFYEELPKSIFRQKFFYLFFLVRDPAEVIISLSKTWKLDDKESFSAYFSDELEFSKEVGTKVLYEIFFKLQQYTANSPKIIFSKQLTNDPRPTLKAFCQAAKIPFLEKHLSWLAGEYEFLDVPKDTNGNYPAWVQSCFGSVIQTKSFQPTRECSRDSSGEPTFEEIEDLELRELFFRVYTENKIYYELMTQAKQHHLLEYNT